MKSLAKTLGLVLLFSVAFITPARAETVFLDLTSDHPDYAAIQYLAEKGALSGYPDQSFRPDRTVNRAEALKTILLASDTLVTEVADQPIFADVLHGTWYAKYVVKAKNLNVVSGDAKTGLFRPGDPVNLAEALKMILAVNKKTTETPKEDPYTDVPKDAWYAPLFAYAKRTGLLDGDLTEANPTQPVTRAMLAELLYRLETSPKARAHGKASFYADKFHGRTTASGEVFDASNFTAAHRTYPFGTWLQVTNTANDRSVLVKVNDRGPYGSKDRIIDLSKGAFEAIASISQGVIDVTVEPASAPEWAEAGRPPEADAGGGAAPDEAADASAPAPAPAAETTSAAVPEPTAPERCAALQGLTYVPKTIFEPLTLTREFPNRAFAGEVWVLTGQADASATAVTAFLVDGSGKESAFSATVVSGTFEVQVPFPLEPGSYRFGLLAGKSGTSKAIDITVVPAACLKEASDLSLPALSGFSARESAGALELFWDNKGGYTIFELKLTQKNRSVRYFVSQAGTFSPPAMDFSDFTPGDTRVSLRGARLTAKSLAEPARLTWGPSAAFGFAAAVRAPFELDSDAVELTEKSGLLQTGAPFTLSVRAKAALRKDAALILPDGRTLTLALSHPSQKPIKNVNGVELFPPSDSPLTLTFTPDQKGAYQVELNTPEGLAALNLPLFPSGMFPLIPNARELASTQTASKTAQPETLLTLTNRERAKLALKPLMADPTLNRLAQYRAELIVKENRFSHWDSRGRSANDLRRNFAVEPPVSENLAKELTAELAHWGLMQSAIHRENALSPEWTRMGVGAAKHPDGSWIFVELFSADPLNDESRETLRRRVLETVNAQREAPLSPHATLTTLAQAWSDAMVRDDFFDFTSPAGKTLSEIVRAAGLSASLGTYLVGNTSFEGALDQISKNEPIRAAAWKSAGIGIARDRFGVLKVTVLYME